MKKLYAFLTLAAGVALCASAQSKFDAQGLLIMDSYRQLQANPSAQILGAEQYPLSLDAVKNRNGAKASIFVTLMPGATAADLEARGFEIVDDLGDLVLANATLAEIEQVSKCDFVRALSFGEKRQALLDRSRIATGVDKIHAGTDLPRAYTGKGVIAGIFDTGVDPNHVNFLNSDLEQRIKALWVYSDASGQPFEYTTPDAISRVKSDDTSGTHGTHTLGCMAGSNKSNALTVAIIDDETGTVSKSSAFKKIANPYYGMAPDAELAVGCGPLYDANISNGVRRVVDYAQSVGKPAVVNLSLGSCMGPHDGSDALSQYLERLGTKALIFLAAGNDGDGNISFDKTFTATDKSHATFFKMGKNLSGYIEMWSSTNAGFVVTPFIYDTVTKQEIFSYDVPAAEGSIDLGSTGGSAAIQDAKFDLAFKNSKISFGRSFNTGSNQRYQVRINAALTRDTSSDPDGRYLFGIKVSGDPGVRVAAVSQAKTGTGVAEFTSYGIGGYAEGTGDWTISSMACGKNTICVGAWSARNRWPALAGFAAAYAEGFAPLNEATPFSSYGRNLQGEGLPHVCAPGTGIISSVSTYAVNSVKNEVGDQFDGWVASNLTVNQKINARQNYYQCEQGTSMATPIVAGGVALWLEADPTLTVDRVKEIIAATSTKDAYYNSGMFPKLKWGAGKFNAYEGLKAVLNASGIDDVRQDGGNSLMVNRTGDDAWEVIVPGASTVAASLYNMQGACVASDKASGNALTLTTDGVTPGIYVLRVNNQLTAKIVVE